ncbi:Oligonucleotide/oligosaccharide-binding protein [Dunaliella salina]|nr:Oligonucleotide/oligosaccharide-binding protein [Dunaliella salina]|eukprot:KAF5842772.1 Oligonucleotide/oligosaccharide-binding protein [Dunaliella salina]
MQLARSKAIAAGQLPTEEEQDNSPQQPEELLVYTIYAAMSHEQQLRAFEPAPPGARKVILATNIAETSITISGVRYVVDPGFVKARSHNPRLGADALQVVPVSQAQAQQRSGRAGREGPGKAYRLYTEQAYDSLEPATVPEILRSNLASVVLQLKALGINDVLGFDFLDKPPIPSIVRSLELLYSLGALDSQGKLTSPVGTSLSRLPVDPMYGKVLLAATSMGCSIEAMQVISMVSTDGVFVVPRAKREEANAARLKFTSKEGDHLTLLAVARAFAELPPKQQTSWCHDNYINIRSVRKAQDIYQQLARQLHQLQLPLTSCGEDPTPLRRALVAGLFPQSARKQPDGTYKVIATGQQVFIHPSSVLIGKKVDCIVFSELVLTTKQLTTHCAPLPCPLQKAGLCHFLFSAGMQGT